MGFGFPWPRFSAMNRDGRLCKATVRLVIRYENTYQNVLPILVLEGGQYIVDSAHESIDDIRLRFESGEFLVEPVRDTHKDLDVDELFGVSYFEVESIAGDYREFLKELEDISLELSGKPTSVDRCREAYGQAKADPSPEKIEQLRQAFAAIPVHKDLWVLMDVGSPAPIYELLGIEFSVRPAKKSRKKKGKASPSKSRTRAKKET